MNSQLSIINDEISNDLNVCIDYLRSEGINQIDLRAINGINLLDINEVDLKQFANYLMQNNIKIGMIISPLFKWYSQIDSAGNSFVTNFDLHGFNPRITTERKIQYIQKAIVIAKIFNCDKIRIFSMIRGDTANLDFYLTEQKIYDYLIAQSNENNISIYLENEPMCNLSKIDEIKMVYRDSNTYHHMKLLLDIGSIYFTRAKINQRELVNLINMSNYIHLKDFSYSKNAYVKIGDGDIPYKSIFSSIADIKRKNFVFETHTQQDLPSLSKSIQFVRSLLG